MPILERAGDRLELMRRTSSVAIVGMSANPARASHFVATYLLGKTDWTLWYVNPMLDEVLGQRCYPSLAELPEVPDMVDVFRRRDELPGVVDEAIAIGARSVWFQLGLRHDDAAATASAAGLDVVQNRCLKIEHARFCGGLHDAGFVTNIIDSRRGPII
jgi:predicted CoA-binding protein